MAGKFRAKVAKAAAKVKARQASKGVAVSDTVATNRAKAIVKARGSGGKASLPKLTAVKKTGGSNVGQGAGTKKSRLGGRARGGSW